MEKMNVLKYLNDKGIQYEKEGKNQVRLVNCPFCMGRNDLTINIFEGLYKCFKCNKSGNFYSFLRHHGDLPDYHTEVETDAGHGQLRAVNLEKLTEQALEYHRKLFTNNYTPALKAIIKELEVSTETLKKLKIGAIRRDKPEGLWVTIPHWSDGVVRNIKFRSLWPLTKAMSQVEAAEKVLYNEDILKDKTRVIFTEGEKDTIKLIHHGFPAVGHTLGAGNKLTKGMEKKLSQAEVWVAFDTDVEGEAGGRKIAEQLGMQRCRKLSVYPSKDVLDFFKENKDAKQQFKDKIRSAPIFTSELIIPMSRAIHDTMGHRYLGDEYIMNSPWQVLNDVVGGFYSEEIVVVSAPRGTGKTTFCLQLCQWAAQEKHIPALFFCKEMSSHRIATRVVQGLRRLNYSELVPADFFTTSQELKNVPLYTAVSCTGTNFDEDAAAIESAVEKYGVKVLAYDNLHFLSRDAVHQVEEIGILMKRFKGLVEDLGILLFLIAQPRKQPVGNAAGTDPMTADDIRGTGSIGDDADKVIILHRQRARGQAQSNDCQVWVAKNRYGPERTASLRFDPELCTFSAI